MNKRELFLIRRYDEYLGNPDSNKAILAFRKKAKAQNLINNIGTDAKGNQASIQTISSEDLQLVCDMSKRKSIKDPEEKVLKKAVFCSF